MLINIYRMIIHKTINIFKFGRKLIEILCVVNGHHVHQHGIFIRLDERYLFLRNVDNVPKCKIIAQRSEPEFSGTVRYRTVPVP